MWLESGAFHSLSWLSKLKNPSDESVRVTSGYMQTVAFRHVPCQGEAARKQIRGTSLRGHGGSRIC